MAFANLLDPILNPLLSLGPFWAIFIISIFVSLFTVITYKYTTNQEHLHKVKAELKRLQEKSKQHTKEGKNEKALKLQKDMMKLNGQYMKASMKSTLYTFLPLIIFFGWLGAHLAFAPLMPVVPFAINVTTPDGVQGNYSLQPGQNLMLLSNATLSANKELSWMLKANATGETSVTIHHEPSGEEQLVSLIISNTSEYIEPLHKVDSSTAFSTIHVGNKKLLIFKGIPILKSFPWIKNWGWFGAYFLFSIIFSTGLRKAMKLA